MTKNYYISELMKVWGYKTLPFKTFYNLKDNWSLDELRLELSRYQKNIKVLPKKAKVSE